MESRIVADSYLGRIFRFFTTKFGRLAALEFLRIVLELRIDVCESFNDVSFYYPMENLIEFLMEFLLMLSFLFKLELNAVCTWRGSGLKVPDLLRAALLLRFVVFLA